MLQRLIMTIAWVSLMGCNLFSPSPTANEAAGEGWQDLLTGRGLHAFQTIGHAHWQWIDDYIEADQASGSFLLTHQSFRDFELHVEFWPSPDANSGVFFHCQDRNLIANETCYELNIFEQHSNPKNATGAIINLAPPQFPALAADKWNAFDISVQGSHITVHLNGRLVSELVDERFGSGPLALQANGGLIRFKNVRVRNL